MSMSFIESFIDTQLPKLPPHIIIDICSYLDHDFIIDFFLFLRNSPVRDVIIDHYFNKQIDFTISPPRFGRSVVRPQNLINIDGFGSIEEFLDDHPDVNPHQVNIITGGDFRSFEALVTQYQERFGGQCGKICYKIESYEFSSEDFKMITTLLPNVHKLQLSRIKFLKCLHELKQGGFARMTRLEELIILGHGVSNWSDIKLPEQLRHLDVSWCQTTDVTTINLPPSLEHLYYNQSGINDDKLSRLKYPTHLKTLMLTYNNIMNVDLSRLPRTLETLDLSYNVVTNFSDDPHNKEANWPPNLITVILRTNNIGNSTLNKLSSFKWPHSLKNLSLDENPFTSLTDLYNLPDTLEYLNISGNKLPSLLVDEYHPRSDIYPYFRFPRFLDKLDLSICQCNFELIKDQSKRIRFPDTLSTLDLTDCNINDLSVFHFPPSLKSLLLSGNRIADLNSYNNGSEINWQQLTLLADLELFSNNITDLSNWFPPPNIRKIILSMNKLTTLTAEIPMFNAQVNRAYAKLNQLHLSKNPIEQVDPLVTMPPNLGKFDLSKTLLKEFHMTSGVLNSNLYELDISGAQISGVYFSNPKPFNSKLSILNLGSNLLLKSPQDRQYVVEAVRRFYDGLEASVGKKVRSRKNNVNSTHFFH